MKDRCRFQSLFTALMLGVLFALGPAITACDNGDDDDVEDGTTDDEGETDDGDLTEADIERIVTEAEFTLNRMVDGAKMYYEGDQIWSPQDGAEPWFPGDADDTPPAGMPVEFQYKSFPGGPDITIRSSEDIPEGGESIEPNPVIEEDVEFDVQTALAPLQERFEEPSYFRYTYETGPGTGEDATATFRAEANFDPDTPEHHTITLTVHTTLGDGASAEPAVTEHEFQ